MSYRKRGHELTISTAVVLAMVGVTAQAQDETPQHGGTLTFVGERAHHDPPGWDIPEAGSATVMYYTNPYAEWLLGADVLTYGPRGTDEYQFGLAQAEVPEEFLRGILAEDWELTTDPLGVRFKIREGVMWTGNPRIGMEPREFTAEDAAFALNRYRAGRQAPKTQQFMDEGAFEAVDKYTLQAHFNRYDASWAWIFGYALYAGLYPPEVVEAGALDWRNAVGTGPFILEDFVEGSYVQYRRNPDWWNKEYTLNGETYDIPFIDELVLPIIKSEATRLAAIRTGRADIESTIPLAHRETLEETSSELIMMESPKGQSLDMIFNSRAAPTDELEFRRAIMIGVDQQEIVDAVIPGGSVGGYPFSRHLGKSVHTPVEEMPEEIAALYGHDPERASQMIAELGKEGVDVPIHYASSDGILAQAAAVMADQLSRVGVNPVLTPAEAAVVSKYQTGDGSGWTGVLLWWGGNSKTARGADAPRSFRYASLHYDDFFNEEMDQTMATIDEVERAARLKEMAVYMIGQVNEVAIGESIELTAWWPWVKNYYGELEAGYTNYNPIFSTLWIDQDLKAEMGY